MKQNKEKEIKCREAHESKEKHTQEYSCEGRVLMMVYSSSFRVGPPSKQLNFPTPGEGKNKFKPLGTSPRSYTTRLVRTFKAKKDLDQVSKNLSEILG